MKRWIGIALLLFCGAGGRAQTFAEFFQQKKTQISYLEKQIAALQAVIVVTEQGYRIVQEGAAAITAIKKGEFDLHSGYFTSLMFVNPVLRSDPGVNDIIDLQTQIVSISGQARSLAIGLPDWSGLVNALFDGLLADCGNDLDWLQLLTTDGEVQMKDAERMQGIDAVYGRMRQRYADAVKVRNDVVFMYSN